MLETIEPLHESQEPELRRCLGPAATFLEQVGNDPNRSISRFVTGGIIIENRKLRSTGRAWDTSQTEADLYLILDAYRTETISGFPATEIHKTPVQTRLAMLCELATSNNTNSKSEYILQTADKLLAEIDQHDQKLHSKGITGWGRRVLIGTQLQFEESDIAEARMLHNMIKQTLKMRVS